MKKAFYSLLALVFINLSASATYTESTSNGYSSPISDTNLSFEASVSGESVKTSWDTFTKDEDNFIYYKIIRSQKNSSPVYPDDGYIYYTTNINTNSYTDKSPLEGTTYYRLCAITSEKERYCSNVVKINFEKGEEEQASTLNSDGYYNPIYDSNLNFKANISGNGIETSWSKYLKNEVFKYYKVIRSETNSNPVYPDDGYIYYDSNVNSLSYKDTTPLNGNAYYRVCAITEENNRYCSNVVKINFEKQTSVTYNQDTNNTTTIANSSNLSNSTKEKLDTLIGTFITKLESKYSENSKRISALEKLIKELEKITKKNIKMKAMVNYLIEKIELKIESYQDDFGNLESIFQNIID